jgi:thiamine biosynthesis lipoprotein
MASDFAITIIERSGGRARDDLAKIADEAFAAIHRLEARISDWQSASQTSEINRHGAERPVRVAPDLFQLIERSRQFAVETGGAFDITVGPLVNLWRNCREMKRIPSTEELAEVLPLIGANQLMLDAGDRTVAFKRPGMKLTLNGIGKGFALDRAAQVLQSYGIGTALLHGGASSMLALGAPPETEGWTVRVTHPYDTQRYIEEVRLRDESMSTSGHVTDFFEYQGERYGHILDPRTGWPVEGRLIAIAFAPSGTETDALSTAFFVMSEEGVRAYCEAHPKVRAAIVPAAENREPAITRINFSE